MKLKHSQTRPDMTWEVQDMTNMAIIDNSSIDTVLDKGALDALFAEDTQEIYAQVLRFYEEILRVLKKGGKYVCITLAESHIFKSILDFFLEEHDCNIKLEVVYGDKPSPFHPYFITITTNEKPLNSDSRVNSISPTAGNYPYSLLAVVLSTVLSSPLLSSPPCPLFSCPLLAVGHCSPSL